jgi:hypothetical protein
MERPLTLARSEAKVTLVMVSRRPCHGMDPSALYRAFVQSVPEAAMVRSPSSMPERLTTREPSE